MVHPQKFDHISLDSIVVAEPGQAVNAVLASMLHIVK